MTRIFQAARGNDYGDRPAVSTPVRSGASILAIVAAILSFYFSSQGREILGLVGGIVAIGAGLLGTLRAVSPHVRGGIMSLAAVGLGVIAILVAVVALIV
jgi:hypothetical protein